MDKYRLLYVLVLSCVTTVLPAQLKDYSSQVDSIEEPYDYSGKSRANDSIFE